MTGRDWIKTLSAAAVMLLCWGTAPVAISFLRDTYSLVFQAFTRYALSMILLWSYQRFVLCHEDWEFFWSQVPVHAPDSSGRPFYLCFSAFLPPPISSCPRVLPTCSIRIR